MLSLRPRQRPADPPAGLIFHYRSAIGFGARVMAAAQRPAPDRRHPHGHDGLRRGRTQGVSALQRTFFVVRHGLSVLQSQYHDNFFRMLRIRPTLPVPPTVPELSCRLPTEAAKGRVRLGTLSARETPSGAASAASVAAVQLLARSADAAQAGCRVVRRLPVAPRDPPRPRHCPPGLPARVLGPVLVGVHIAPLEGVRLRGGNDLETGLNPWENQKQNFTPRSRHDTAKPPDRRL